jgi:hypothetical protein
MGGITPRRTRCRRRRVNAPTLKPARGYDRAIMRGRARALVLLAALVLAGCGGAAVTQDPSSPTASSPVATGVPGGSGAPVSAITITRSGGIAGMHDVVVVAPDNSAHVTQKNGVMSACTPSVAAIERVRSTDLAALGPAPSKIPIMDGFGYDVVTDSGRASVGDGDSGAHGELLAAAAEVVSSCLSTLAPAAAFE